MSLVCPGLFKVDVNAAYRRIPIRPEDRWVAGVAYRFQGQVLAAMHYAMPFGAIASVHEWEGLGNELLDVILNLLGVVCFQYVDDYFGAGNDIVVLGVHRSYCCVCQNQLRPCNTP